MEINIDKNYWENRWLKNETGWDIGYAAPAMSAYIQQFQNKSASILIPGCGNAHEAMFLVECGFTDITLIDIAVPVVEALQRKFKSSDQVKVLCEDFFMHEGEYDLIIEQTFFCAIPPSRREEYVQKIFSLLSSDGRLVGLLFNKHFNHSGPPFGGTQEQYRRLFEKLFKIEKLERCYNSIEPRVDTELFINFLKRPPLHL
jgi:SAM-dependent methyltransferase